MKKLLITGFEPFGGEDINPSWEAVMRLPDQIGEYALTKLLIPVVFGKAAKNIMNHSRPALRHKLKCWQISLQIQRNGRPI